MAGMFWGIIDSASSLPLRNSAGHLLDLSLVFAARSGPLRLGGGLLAGGAFQLLALQLVFNPGGVGHVVPLSHESLQGSPSWGYATSRIAGKAVG